jgi:type II secretory pathway pseudopilin PulG
MKTKLQSGFTLMEMIVAIGIFMVLLVGVIGLYSLLVRSVKAGREQTVLAGLAADYLEIVKNLPYSQVGTATGNPNGTLADQNNPISTVIEATTYQIYYEVTYIDDPADGLVLSGTDPAPDDYKQIKMYIKNTTTSSVTAFSTNVTPKGLEGTVNAGALLVKVFDAQGQPIANAPVHIENIARTILLDRTTDSAGNWIEVGLPQGTNGYHIVVAKPGYSTDQTYPLSAGNPNPTKPDPTILNGQVTQVSFSIDKLSNLTIKTLNSTCGALSNVNLNISGAKLIGTSPTVLKFNSDLTSAAGQVALSNIEWDNYTPTLLPNQNLMVLGTSPIQQISVLPGASQTYSMILGTQTPNSFWVYVKDAATSNALEDATVSLHKDLPVKDYSAITGGSVWLQSDWTGGSGQSNYVLTNRYFSDDGNIDTSVLPAALRLKKISGNYVSSGQLISSTFDTGGSSKYTTVSWQPTSQNPSTTMRLQIATNNDNATWDYKGPDGTAATFYTVAGTNIAPVHNNDRYVRYKVFLDTTDNNETPVLTNLGLNYIAGCFTPGQVSFPGLTAGSDYTLTVSLAGYQNFIADHLTISGNQSLEVLMSP